MTHPAPQADRMIRQAASNLIHLASLYGFVPTIETKPGKPLAMGNHTLQLNLRPVRHPDPTAADNCRRPHVLEKLSYHEGARDDMSLEECISFLANGWRETPGRTTTQLVLQLTELLAGAPFRAYCNDDCRAYTQGTEAELQALRKKVATYQARDALGLVPQPTGELGPDGKEWAKTAAGYAHVEVMLPRADGHQSVGPYWYGWALRGAFVAGAEWQEARNLPAPATPYAPLSAAEARDLTCMLAGAPWPDEMLPELQRLLGIYDGLRARGQRPVDPATLPRKVAKVVMKTGLLPANAQQAAQAVQQAGKCAQCKQAYTHGSGSVGCPKCAPGVAIVEAEFQKPIAEPQPSALATIEQALRDYHFALDSRQHAGVAADQAVIAISQAMGMRWKQGEEAARRAAQLEQQDKAT